MEHRELVYSGYLLLPPMGKILLKKAWQQKFCLLFKASKFGIERLEVYDTVDTTKNPPFRIITLENCIKITIDSPTHFTVTTKTAPFQYEFGTVSVQSKNEWLHAFQSVAFPDDLSVITSIEEDNDLYCSAGEPLFHVKILQSAASERCGLVNKTHTLILTSTAIQLINNNDGTLLYTWPYCYIRRYGYKSGKFTFEAGRKCDSGEGTFILEHPNQQEIFRCLGLKMKSMKKLLKEDHSPQILDSVDNPLHAALSMEARSRSPLPPSPTASTSVDLDLSNKTQITILDSPENSIKPKPTIKPPKPTKPPRMSLANKPQTDTPNKSFTDNYEPIRTDKYDQIEFRNDAWRTLGVDEVKHTENVGPEDEEDYLSWGMVKRSLQDIQVQITAPKIITETPASAVHGNYDKLNFFGSSCKLNDKSPYKQISLAPLSALPSPPSFNDYDEVQPSMESARSADDSHLGYALIRKEPNKDKDESVNHQFHNNEPYAVISKPKRV